MNREALLLVEGKDDERVVDAITRGTQIHSTFEIRWADGFSWITLTLQTALRTTGLQRLGVVADADTDLAARWMSLRNILASRGYANVPESPDPKGTIIASPVPLRPRVGIWLMPDNCLPGMLEDFTALLVPPGDPLFVYARDCVRGLPHVRFPRSHIPKADIHTWLAWQEEPGKPLGTAITARFLDAALPPAQAFRQWLVRLFG